MHKELDISENDALLVIDMQNDFLPGGALAVAEGNWVIGPLNELLPRFPRAYATRDWHPRNHKSFKPHGGPWPIHCVQDTLGAGLSPKLNTQYIDAIVSTGVEPDRDGYSGFEGTDLERQLNDAGVKRVFIGGLATDYCVKATALEARRLKFQVVVITDAIGAVNLKPGDGAKALDAMRACGCVLIESKAIRSSARARPPTSV
jgi:nicotinamidase/pyrazinamidase